MSRSRAEAVRGGGRKGLLSLLLCATVWPAPGCAPEGAPAASASATITMAPAPGPSLSDDPSASGDPEELPERRAEAPAFRRPDHVRGIYLNAWAAGSSRRVEELIALADRTEINAFVIDLKDASGYLSHRSGLELARSTGADGQIRIRALPDLLERLRRHGIYPIARIVVAKDPVLASARPDWAIRDVDGGVWTDSKGATWLDPWNPEMRRYHLELARELALLGFPEIQWDYIRFPDASPDRMAAAVFPAAPPGGERSEAIRSFLGEARALLDSVHVRSTADVFGVTTSVSRDLGIGQVWESFIDQVDAALPMVYPSHYSAGFFGIGEPNARPYEVVRRALEDALARSAGVPGAGAVIPWLQDFTLGLPRYGADEVRAQIRGTYDAGIREWVLWNPSSRYTEEALEPEGTPGVRNPPEPGAGRDGSPPFPGQVSRGAAIARGAGGPRPR